VKRIFITLSVFAALAVSCMASHAEEVALSFDNRQWELGYHTVTDQQEIREFVLKGESVKKWTELVTVQAFPGLQLNVDPEDYMNGMAASLKKACPGAKVKLIRKGASDIVFEWEINSCSGQDNQYEIDRIIAGDRAMYVLHYAIKDLPISSGRRSEWIKILDQASLTGE
jgi:hypothetical protein